MPNYTDPLNLIVSILIFTIGLFGILCNSAIVYVFFRERSEKTSFNLICFFRAISNIVIFINAFMITFLPKTFLGFPIFPPSIETWLINITTTLYLANEYQIVLIALNRFCALFFPFKYSKIFSVLNTTIILIFIYVYRIIKRISEVLPQSEKGCYALYSPEALTWYYDLYPLCDWNDDALKVIIYIFIAMAILNTITFIKILHFFRKRENDNQDVETRRRMRKNTIYFLQTMLQDSLYLIDLTFTFELSTWSDHRVWTYFCGTFIWECLHSIDGLIMVIFNEKFSFFKKKQATSSSIPIITTPINRRGTISVSTSPINKL